MKKYTVYCHTNKINNKKYVGITSQTLYARWQNGKHYNRHKSFYEDIIKYGWDNFNHEIILETNDKNIAKDKEVELIKNWDLINPKYGYNKFKGGIIPTCSERTRKKLSKLNSGCNNKFYNHKHNDETKKIMSERKPKKEVICIETNTTYKGIRIAERTTGINRTSIIRCCKGIKETAGGFHWKYKGGEVS